MNLLDRAAQFETTTPGAGLMLPPTAVIELAREAALSVEQLMLGLIPVAQKFSQPTLSGFRVGAVAMGGSGALYFGANSELDSSSLANTIHAEQAAVVCAIMHDEASVEKVAVSAPPCGYCRQFLHELSSADRLQILLADRPPITLAELLSGAFGPADLGVQGGLLGSARVALEWVSPVSSPVAEAAMDAAARSYAPYTGAVAGVGLVVSPTHAVGGDTTFRVCGPYLENAAFNPSISALQTSLIALSASGCSPSEITEAALVQLVDSKVAHADAAAVLLNRLAPHVRLQVFTVRRV